MRLTKMITAEKIIEIVADTFEVSVDEIKGRERDSDVQKARRIAMYLLNQEVIYSWSQIGQQLGNRDAVAVITGCQWVGKRIKTDPILNLAVNWLRVQIQREELKIMKCNRCGREFENPGFDTNICGNCADDLRQEQDIDNLLKEKKGITEVEFESLVDKASQPLEPKPASDSASKKTSESQTSGDCSDTGTH